MKDAGYEPEIRFDCGRIINISMEFHKILCIIKTQQLTTSAIDGMISVNTEDKYNNMTKAMNTFNNNLFKREHKSYYTQQDIDILDEYRTIANAGTLHSLPKNEQLVEID